MGWQGSIRGSLDLNPFISRSTAWFLGQLCPCHCRLVTAELSAGAGRSGDTRASSQGCPGGVSVWGRHPRRGFTPCSLPWQYVSEQLLAHKQLVVSTCSVADIQAAFNTTVSRIQR